MENTFLQNTIIFILMIIFGSLELLNKRLKQFKKFKLNVILILK
jgi:hypothetical protein